MTKKRVVLTVMAMIACGLLAAGTKMEQAVHQCSRIRRWV